MVIDEVSDLRFRGAFPPIELCSSQLEVWQVDSHLPHVYFSCLREANHEDKCCTFSGDRAFYWQPIRE
jgi:hypothetical protein